MIDYIVLGGSSRSVGRSEASNSFALLIPCHRVVHADFSIGGYKLDEKVKLEILLSKTEATKKLKG